DAMPEVRGNHAEEDERRDHVRRTVQHGVVQLRDGRRVADVVDVRMGHQQEVDLAERERSLYCAGAFGPWVSQGSITITFPPGDSMRQLAWPSHSSLVLPWANAD